MSKKAKSRKQQPKKKQSKTFKERVYVYFADKAEVERIMRAAARSQKLARPNISRFCVDAAIAKAEDEERLALAAERQFGTIEHTA